MSLRSVFFAEFHAMQGPIVTAHYPPIVRQDSDLASSSNTTGIWDRLMDDISEYLIPKPELCGHLVSLAYGDNAHILGCPVVIEGSKYARNALIFNLGFVFDIDVDADVLQDFEHVVYKVARFLRQMELEEEFISSNAAAGNSSMKMHRILERMFCDLNVTGEVHVELDSANSLDLCLRRCAADILPFSTSVDDLDVPIIIVDDFLNAVSQSDLTVQTLLQHTNGIDTIVTVARNAHVDLEIAKKAFKELVYHGFVSLVDLFMFSNIYLSTSRLMDMFQATHDQLFELQSCFTYSTNVSGDKLALLFKIFSMFDGTQTVRQIVSGLDNTDVVVDIRKLVVVGTILGYLKRLDAYIDI